MNTKKIHIIICLLFHIIIFSQNRANINVHYETKLISDSLNKDKILVMNFVLIANNTKSLYFNEEAKNFYDVLSGKKQKNESDVISTSMGNIPKYPKYNGSAYNDGNKLTVSLPVGKYIFNFTEPKLHWEVLPETKKIKDYKCQLAKATADNGDVFYAWFTQEVPISEGPFRFKGLAGLILEVYNKNRTITIVATEIKKSDELIEPIKYLNAIEAKSKQQYLEARSNYIENPAMYNGNIRIFDSSGNETTKGISQRLKKNNVFLD